MYYWRTPSVTEVDLIWKCGKRAVRFEIKSTDRWKPEFNKGLNALVESGDIEQAYGIYRGDRRLNAGQIRVLPFQQAIQMAWAGEFE